MGCPIWEEGVLAKKDRKGHREDGVKKVIFVGDILNVVLVFSQEIKYKL